MWVQRLEGVPRQNLGGHKTSKIRRDFWHFRIWARITPEQIEITKIGNASDQLQPLPRRRLKIWTVVHKHKNYRCTRWPTQLDCFRETALERYCLSEILLSRVFRAAIFGERPRQAADAHLLLLAGSQHRCSVGRAEARKGWLRCVGIFDWKDWQKKRVQWSIATRHDHLAGNIPWAECFRFRRALCTGV